MFFISFVLFLPTTKKLFILFLSLTLTSCFTEPKKSKEKASEVKNITSYEKEDMTLDVLNKLIGFEINDFKFFDENKWKICKKI